MDIDKIKILVPIDFKKHTKNTLNFAAFYAKSLNGEIHLLYVVEPEGMISELFEDNDYEKQLSRGLEKLNDLAKELSSQSVDVKIIAKKGKVYETILDYSEDIKADYIIMATGGADSFKRRFIGSNTLRVIRSAEIPVISLRDENLTHQIKNIILPLDIRKETRQKVNTAIRIAKSFNATINIISISESDDEKEGLKWLEAVTIQVKDFIKNAGVEFTVKHLNIPENEKMSDAVIQFSKENNGDLIIIMTQQEVALSELFVGYFAQSVINNAVVPVCTINPIDTTIVKESFRAQG
jgi:nucleotide-binding universal stress UspA family protein